MKAPSVNRFGLAQQGDDTTAVMYTEQEKTVRAGIVPVAIADVTDALIRCAGDRQQMWDYLDEGGIQWEWSDSKMDRFREHFMSQEFIWGL